MTKSNFIYKYLINNKYIFLIVLFFTISCSDLPNDADSFNLNGKIQRIVEIEYNGSEKFGKYIPDFENVERKVICDFNSYNNIEKILSYDSEGNLYYKGIFQYNEKGYCIASEESYPKNESTNKHVYKLENGKNISTEIYDKNGNLINSKKNYFSNYDIIKTESFKPNGEKDNTYLHKYDNGLRIESIVLDSAGNEVYKKISERNNQGDVIMEIKYFPNDGYDTLFFDYEYDNKSNWIKKYEFYRKGKIDNITLRDIFYLSEVKVDDEIKIIGIWTSNKENYWYDFNKNGSFDYGYKSKIKYSGIWEIDKVNFMLTLKTDNSNNSQKFSYKLIGNEMTLSTIQGVEKSILNKK